MQVAEKVGPTVGLVKITREVYEGKTKSTPMLTFNSPFTRPFGLSPIKCRMIADHPELMAGFLAEHRQDVGQRIAVEKAKASRAGKGTQAAMQTVADAIEAMPDGVSKEDILAALRQVQGKKAAPAPAAKPVLDRLPAAPAPAVKAEFTAERKRLCKALARLAKSYSYTSIGRIVNANINTVKAWCQGDYLPTRESCDAIIALLKGYEERDPDVISRLTKAGGNRGWNG